MELSEQHTNIPVYLHIPKNAGTYSITVLVKYFVRITNDKDFSVKRITVEIGTTNLTIIVRFLTDYWKTDSNMKHHPIAVSQGIDIPRSRSCNIETFKTYLQNKQLELLGIVVEPSGSEDMRPGLFLAHDLIDMINGHPVNFTILRDPFSRQQSLFQYLSGDESSHEPTHGMIRENTFAEYLSSVNLEDSWVIRVFTGMSNTIAIDKNWFRMATEFFDHYNFIVGDISQTDVILNKVLHQCFSQGLEGVDKENPYYNSTKKENKITIEDLDEHTKQKFLDRTYWDRKLWKRYLSDI